MNYDQTITELVEAIRVDKSIIQPWRNKAVARLEEAQAFVRMGKTSTMSFSDEIVQFPAECICPTGAIDTRCPQHRGM